ncbi:MAG: hypothetical protein Q7S00_01200 [bacterium]|nr:hypothetical protein [bacterium]
MVHFPENSLATLVYDEVMADGTIDSREALRLRGAVLRDWEEGRVSSETLIGFWQEWKEQFGGNGNGLVSNLFWYGVEGPTCETRARLAPEDERVTLSLGLFTLENEGEVFARNPRWKTEAATAKEELLLVTRRLVAVFFDGKIPTHFKIPGVARQSETTTLNRWLKGEKINVGVGRVRFDKFYSQVRALLYALRVSPGEIDRLIENAVFEQNRKWKREASTPQERLLLTARQLIARRGWNRVPYGFSARGIAYQGSQERGYLNQWLRTGKIPTGLGSDQSVVYSQMRHLFLALGVTGERIDEMIEAAVFEKREWTTEAVAARSRLLLRVRQTIAKNYGEEIIADTGIDGIPVQSPDATLRLWIGRGWVRFNRNLSEVDLYSQIYLLLVGLKLKPREVNELIKEAFLEELTTPGNTHFFKNFSNRVRIFLMRLGVSREEADSLITKIVFEKTGWPQEAKTAHERLLLEVRRRMAVDYGGVLPADKDIKGVSAQGKRGMMIRWISGERIELRNKGWNTPGNFYSQAHALLHHLGMEDEEIDRFIEPAKEESLFLIPGDKEGGEGGEGGASDETPSTPSTPRSEPAAALPFEIGPGVNVLFDSAPVGGIELYPLGEMQAGQELLQGGVKVLEMDPLRPRIDPLVEMKGLGR